MKKRALLWAASVVIFAAIPLSAANAASFTAEKYPASIAGSSTTDIFDFSGSTVSCQSNTFTGSLVALSPELVLTALFGKCTIFGGAMPFTVPPEAFKLTSDGTLHLTKEFQIDWLSGEKPMCIYHVKPGTSKVTITNSFPNLVVSGNPQWSFIQTRLSALCPVSTEGTITWTIPGGGITLKGTSGGVPDPIHLK